MFKFRSLVALVVFAGAYSFASAQGAASYPGLGRDATVKEVAAWDIDVRPDFKGLPAGAGSVAKGQDVWEGKCASCHGFFGESGEVFSPLVGGIGKEDIKTGRVAKLTDASFPGRTTFMKVSSLSTIWDYINRAMPWTAPKTLTTEEVYAVTAFLLNLNGIVPDNFTLSDKNIEEVQQRMPNRNGMTTAHNMWPGKEFKGTSASDTKNVACMKDCVPEVKVASYLPDFARNAHGNLAEQNRLVGPQRGADTTKPEPKGAGAAAKVSLAVPAVAKPADTKPSAGSGTDSKTIMALLNKYSCTACHGMDKKVVGPGFTEIAKKHSGKTDYIAQKIKQGGSGVWGSIPMPAQALSEAEAATLAQWIAAGAGK